MKLSIAVFLGIISYSEAIKIMKDMPEYWHEMVSDEFYADTWGQGYSHNGALGHMNETAYLADSPLDYYFD